jgi:uncharacterized protein (TIGR00730 family)
MPDRVCVFAGSAAGGFEPLAAELGRAIAARGLGLVYGGGRAGLMGAVADAALEAGGEVIGVLPAALDERELGHRGLTELHVVGTIHERKAMMAELSRGFAVLPGGLGTLEELAEALTWTQLGLHHKPVALLEAGGFWRDLLALLDHLRSTGFVRDARLPLVADTPEALLDALLGWDGGPAPRPELAVAGPLVGVSAVVERDGRVLLGLRRGAHGEGEWAFPGGKPGPGETPADAVARELAEETGLRATRVEPLTWTDDRWPGLHFVTLHHRVEAEGEPEVLEPAKCLEWRWCAWDELPEPLFGPVSALLRARPPRPRG